MISQALILKDDKILMVRQCVKRGDIVWNYPGGGIEANETPEQACIREVKEETGLIVKELELIHETDKKKYTYYVKSFEGNISLDKNLQGNEDIVEVKWIGIDEHDYFDPYTRPMLEHLLSKLAGRSML